MRAAWSIHSNTIEDVFSVFKRGMIGVYQHCGEAHLHRYLAEFDFRYNRRSALGVSDAERADDAACQDRGKRLTYRRIGEAASRLSRRRANFSHKRTERRLTLSSFRPTIACAAPSNPCTLARSEALGGTSLHPMIGDCFGHGAAQTEASQPGCAWGHLRQNGPMPMVGRVIARTAAYPFMRR